MMGAQVLPMSSVTCEHRGAITGGDCCMIHRLAAWAALGAATLLAGCVQTPPLGYDVLAARCPALTAAGPVEASRPIYFVGSNLPDCRGPVPLLTVGRGTPMPYGSPTPYGGPVRYGVATAPTAPKQKQPDLALVAADAWHARLAKDLAASGGRLLFFVHGYNNSPFAALERADLIAAAAHFDGPVVAFVWPSQASLTKYTWDEENARWTQPYADALLADLAGSARDVLLVSHSMGNRIAIDALRALERSSPEVARRIHTMVLADPDIDREMFDRDIAGSLVAPGRSITLYASDHDLPLRSSGVVHGAFRVGDLRCGTKVKGARCYAAPVKGMDIVDLSDVSATLLGHADFVEGPAGNADLCRVLNGKAPRARDPVAKGDAYLLTAAAATREDCPEGKKRLRP